MTFVSRRACAIHWCGVALVPCAVLLTLCLVCMNSVDEVESAVLGRTYDPLMKTLPFYPGEFFT